MHNLKTHMLKHQGIKPFKCDFCDFHTKVKTYLKTHIATQHEGKKPYKCDICDVDFAWDSQLSRHITKFHKNNAENVNK